MLFKMVECVFFFLRDLGRNFSKKVIECYRGLMKLRALVLLFNWGQIHLPTFSRAVDLRPLFSPFFRDV
jgi:hypothetical protein